MKNEIIYLIIHVFVFSLHFRDFFFILDSSNSKTIFFQFFSPSLSLFLSPLPTFSPSPLQLHRNKCPNCYISNFFPMDCSGIYCRKCGQYFHVIFAKGKTEILFEHSSSLSNLSSSTSSSPAIPPLMAEEKRQRSMELFK